ncbi:MAG TPA: hypothetical protein VFL67_00435 [Mycobacterium sp.]|nr:hypothetical protein [Mycobacterium sp.]
MDTWLQVSRSSRLRLTTVAAMHDGALHEVAVLLRAEGCDGALEQFTRLSP